MAEDDKKSLLTSLPGILTGLAAVLAAAGALIYHNQTKPKNPQAEAGARVDPAGIQPPCGRLRYPSWRVRCPSGRLQSVPKRTRERACARRIPATSVL